MNGSSLQQDFGELSRVAAGNVLAIAVQQLEELCFLAENIFGQLFF
jgi:hypothetical protein